MRFEKMEKREDNSRNIGEDRGEFGCILEGIGIIPEILEKR